MSARFRGFPEVGPFFKVHRQNHFGARLHKQQSRRCWTDSDCDCAVSWGGECDGLPGKIGGRPVQGPSFPNRIQKSLPAETGFLKNRKCRASSSQTYGRDQVIRYRERSANDGALSGWRIRGNRDQHGASWRRQAEIQEVRSGVTGHRYWHTGE